MRGRVAPARVPARVLTRVPALALALTLALVTLAGVSGCRGDGQGPLQGVRADIALAPTPPVVGPNRAVITLTDASGDPLSATSVELEGTMTHAGMVPVLREATPDGGGRYRVDDFEFSMGGDWILRVHVELADGRAGILERETRVVSRP